MLLGNGQAMCIVLLAHQVHPRYPLVLIANRDERYLRPTRRMQVWEHPPRILAGKDLEAGGTWLGLDDKARLALLTNYREPGRKRYASSRGRLPLDYLSTAVDEQRGFEERLELTREHFAGYNLLFGSVGKLSHYSNRDEDIHRLEPGYHGLSNAGLNTPWPKVERGKRLLQEALESPALFPESLFDILRDVYKPDDAALPETGLPLSLERELSSIFISGEDYGSRSGTVIVADSEGEFRVWERDYLSGEERAFTLLGGVFTRLNLQKTREI